MSKVDVVSVARQPRLQLNLVALVDIGAREIIFACALALTPELNTTRGSNTLFVFALPE